MGSVGQNGDSLTLTAATVAAAEVAGRSDTVSAGRSSS